MSTTGKRLSHEASRQAALEAASRLLTEAGPQAVTLKAVASRIGRTHANLLHHFGSAAGLQKALAGHLAAQVCDSIAEVVLQNRQGLPDPARVVDMIFNAFNQQGAGALATWMILSGNDDALDPVVDAIHDLIDEIGQGHEDYQMHEDTLHLVLLAMGDALLGEGLAKALGMPPTAARAIATKALAQSPRILSRMAEVKAG
jgi:AcrR family transcriptional regulator